MFKKIAQFLALPVIAIVGITLPVHAVDVLTDQQINSIKTQCTEILSTLNQLHQSDALLRHDRGQLYRTISEKLMVPLNQRIASNKLDGGNLVKITADYTAAYQIFYDAYKDYEISLTNALNTDCVKQPAGFYDRVNDAREKRQALHNASATLVKLADDYKKEFDSFRQKQVKAA